jgi:hypothetical protein
MKLCTSCRVHPADYHNGRGSVCENCARNLTSKYGWTWHRGSSDIVGADVATSTSVSTDLNQTDQQGAQIDAAFSNCGGGDATTIAQWQAFYAGYQKFSSASRSTLNDTVAQLSSPPMYLYNLQQIDNSLQSYVQQMNTWAATSRKICGGSATQNIPAPSPSGGLVKSITDPLTTISDNLKTVAIVGLCVGAGLFIYSLYEGHKTAGKALDFATAHPEVLL